MLKLFLIYSYVAVTILYAAFISIGISCYFTALLRWQWKNIISFISYGLLIGLLPLFSLLYLYNIFFAINWHTYLIFFVLACGGIALKYFRSKNLFAFTRKNFLLGVLGFAVLSFCCALAVRGFTREAIGDAWFYHLYSIRLINEYPAIYGIVNLHFRLAQTEASFYLAAFLNFYPFVPRTMLMNTATAFLIFIYATYTIKLFCDNTFTAGKILCATALIGIFLLWQWSDRITLWGISDFDMTLMQLLAFLMLVEFWIKAKEQTSLANETKILLWALIFIACLSAWIKLSAIVFFFVLLCAICVCSCVNSKFLTAKKLFNIVLIPLLFCLLFALPYFGQNIIKSGSLVFPVTFTDLGFKWSNTAFADAARLAVLGDARFSGSLRDPTIGWWWIGHWLKGQEGIFLWFSSVTCSLLILHIYLEKVTQWKYLKSMLHSLLLLTLLLLPILIYWFLIMPNIRFLGIAPLLPSILIIFYSLLVIQERQNSFARESIIVCKSIFHYLKKYYALPILLAIIYFGPLANLPRIPQVYKAEFDKVKNSAGVEVYKPARVAYYNGRKILAGESIFGTTLEGLPGDTALFPASPFLDAGLRYLVEGDPSKGFYIDNSLTK